jgi:hypothetical protein
MYQCQCVLHMDPSAPADQHYVSNIGAHWLILTDKAKLYTHQRDIRPRRESTLFDHRCLSQCLLHSNSQSQSCQQWTAEV